MIKFAIPFAVWVLLPIGSSITLLSFGVNSETAVVVSLLLAMIGLFPLAMILMMSEDQ